MDHRKSMAAFTQAQERLSGGVDSPVRAFANVDVPALFIDHASGCDIVDVDGNHYIDYIGSWGPMILGHLHPYVMETFMDTMKKGISFGLSSSLESELARLVIDAYPAVEMVRFVTSGTEATMSALRVARGFTKRDKIIKFAGCYHGHHDSMLVAAGSGAMTFSHPNSLGVPTSMVSDTLVAPYNDLTAVKHLFETYPNEIAAIIVEPVAANMGVVLPKTHFLSGLRALCDEYGALLIFDEVITGFRLAYGGAAAYFGITPDLACFGKIIGGGMSVGAYGGRREIMSLISPSGGVYQAGTLAGNPLAMSLGIRQLCYLHDHAEVYTQLDTYGKLLQEGICQLLKRYELPYHVQRIGSLMTLFFHDQEVVDYDGAVACDQKAFAIVYRSLLEQGILTAPSQFEAIFISAAHQMEHLQKTLNAYEHAFMELVK